MKYPREIWADTDLIGDDEPHETWQKYVRCGWIDCKESLPSNGEFVLSTYHGVYGPRLVMFWLDGAGTPHFGLPTESDGKGSQPATHWLPLPL